MAERTRQIERVPDDLWAELKAAAALRKVTLRQLVIGALRVYLSQIQPRPREDR